MCRFQAENSIVFFCIKKEFIVMILFAAQFIPFLRAVYCTYMYYMYCSSKSSFAVQRKVYFFSRLGCIVITDFQQTSYILCKRLNLGLKIFFKTSILIKDRELPLGLTKSNCVLREGVLSVLPLKVLYAVALQYKEKTLIKETLHVNKI